MIEKIKLPLINLREYQKPLWRYLQNGGKKAFCLWHRRSGKDIVLWNFIICKAVERVGIYFYFLPTYTQGKKIIWDGITNDGIKFIEYIPKELIKNQNGQEMKIELINGSLIQIIGTDNYDSIRGTNPIGCVFSEYAFQNPQAWEVVKPILKVNGGWSVFNTTPNGKNHAFDLWNMAINNTDWFTELLTVTDTNVLSPQDIEEERTEGMSEEMIQQEYYVSFDIGTLGSYYSNQIKEINERNGICSIPIDKAMDTDVFMDLGKNDATSIGFLQMVGKEYRIIDFYEDTNKDIEHYAKEIKDKGLMIRNLYLPHDAFAKRLESPKTIAEQFSDYGFKVIRIPKLDINQGIQLVRKTFPKLWINKDKCTQLIRAIENYHHEWDEVKKVFKDNPFHDWSSHACDMLRYMCVGIQETTPSTVNDYKHSVNEYIGKQHTAIPFGQGIEYEKKTFDYNAQVENYIK